MLASRNHQIFVLAAKSNPALYEWNQAQIQTWFTIRKIQVPDGHLKESVTRCLRHIQPRDAVKKMSRGQQMSDGKDRESDDAPDADWAAPTDRTSASVAQTSGWI